MKPLGAGLFLVVATVSSCAGAADWPMPSLPDGARAESVGDDMTLNGHAMRVTRFHTAADCASVQAHFRQALGDRRVETRWPGRWAVGRVEADRVVTVLVAPGAEGCGGTVTATRLERDPRVRADEWPLPADSIRLSDLVSWDADRRSRQLLVRNRHSVATNEAHFARLLRGRGLVPMESEGAAARRVLWFSGRMGDAVVTLNRSGELTDVTLTIMEGRR